MTKNEIKQKLEQWRDEGLLIAKSKFYDPNKKSYVGLNNALSRGEIRLTDASKVVCKSEIADELQELFDAKRVFIPLAYQQAYNTNYHECCKRLGRREILEVVVDTKTILIVTD